MGASRAVPVHDPADLPAAYAEVCCQLDHIQGVLAWADELGEFHSALGQHERAADYLCCAARIRTALRHVA